VSQITTGLRGVLSHPTVYSTFQYLMGAKQGWSLFVNSYVRPKNGDAILDIGCGPADIVEYLPRVDYWGFDVSEEYIAKAKVKYGKCGRFYAKSLTLADIEDMPKFDLVIVCGLLHHVNDQVANDIFNLAHAALKSGGRLVTIDPCFSSDQSFIARFLISKDRGQNVRNLSGYESLAGAAFSKFTASVKHKAWIPYTHCIIECTK
jgi:SAM-dependent methyltransferase